MLRYPGNASLFHERDIHIGVGLLIDCYALSWCLCGILPWSVVDLWSLVTASCSRHMEGGCLLKRTTCLGGGAVGHLGGGRWALDGIGLLECLHGGLELTWGRLGCNSDHVGGVDLEGTWLRRSVGVLGGLWRKSVRNRLLLYNDAPVVVFRVQDSHHK